jgi:hypothetical protein
MRRQGPPPALGRVAGLVGIPVRGNAALAVSRPRAGHHLTGSVTITPQGRRDGTGWRPPCGIPRAGQVCNHPATGWILKWKFTDICAQ